MDERLLYFLNVPGVAANPKQMADVFGTGTWALVYYALPPTTVSDSFREFMQSVEKTRLDKQIGSAPSAAASTSTVSKTGLSALVGIAFESGAVTQTIEQNVVTLRANADGLMRFVSNREVFPACDSHDPGCDASGPLKDLEVAASFTASEAGTNRRQFSSATARYAIQNDRDVRSETYRKKWLEWFQANRTQLAAAGQNLLTFVDALVLKAQQTNALDDRKQLIKTDRGANVDVYTQWLTETEGELDGKSIEPAKEVLGRRLDILLERMRQIDPQFDTSLKNLADAYIRYFAMRRDLASTLIVNPALTAEYTYSEPALQSKLHTAKVAFAFSPRGTPGTVNPGTFTVNGGFDFYHEAQPTGSRWKDAQFALQFDRALGPADSPAQFSLGAYYQYQRNAGIIQIPAGATVLPGTNIPLPPNTTQLLIEKGSLFAAQATLTLQKPGSGMKIPFGISWSNRTELVKGNEVRGHVGFTFDSSPLFLLNALR